MRLFHHLFFTICISFFIISCSLDLTNDIIPVKPRSSEQTSLVNSSQNNSSSSLEEQNNFEDEVEVVISEKQKSSSSTEIIQTDDKEEDISSSSSVYTFVLTDTRDGEKYTTTKIGSQIWMAQDLRYNPQTGSSSCPLERPTLCQDYGRLYSWSTAMGFDTKFDTTVVSNSIQRPHQGICPEGWHVPSEAEWITLAEYTHSRLEDTKTETALGNDLISTTGWSENARVQGTDRYGFAAKGTGIKPIEISYVFRTSAYFIIDSESKSDPKNRANYIFLYPSNNTPVNPTDIAKKRDQTSLRCLQN